TLPPGGNGGPMHGVMTSAPPNEVSPMTVVPEATALAVAHVAFDARGWIVTSSSKDWGAGGGPPGGGGGLADMTAMMTSRAVAPSFVNPARPYPPERQLELEQVSSRSTKNGWPIGLLVLAESLLPAGTVAL